MTDDKEWDRGASFSRCGSYRYDLWRIWNRDKDFVTFIMLNPSTADVYKNDPTVERCQRFALAWGFGGLHVCNIFALRTTYPKILRENSRPVGRGNDAMILKRAQGAGKVICAWGNHGAFLDRGEKVVSKLLKRGIQPHAFDLTLQGQPKHPLYLRKTARAKPWNGFPRNKKKSP